MESYKRSAWLIRPATSFRSQSLTRFDGFQIELQHSQNEADVLKFMLTNRPVANTKYYADLLVRIRKRLVETVKLLRPSSDGGLVDRAIGETLDFFETMAVDCPELGEVFVEEQLQSRTSLAALGAFDTIQFAKSGPCADSKASRFLIKCPQKFNGRLMAKLKEIRSRHEKGVEAMFTNSTILVAQIPG